MEAICKILGAVVLVLVAVTGMSVLCAWPLQWLWNSTMPDVFGMRELSFWQSLRLLFICGLLFNRSGSSSGSK